jgi:hypothetical protein
MEEERFATLLRKKRFNRQRKSRLIGAVVCVLLFTAQSVGYLAMAIWARGKLEDIDIAGYRLILLATEYKALAYVFAVAMVWAIAWLVNEVTKTRLDYAVFELIERVEKLESLTPETRATDHGQTG